METWRRFENQQSTFFLILILEVRVQKNNLLLIVPSWGPSFKISFELKVFSFSSCSPTKMANYLTFTATDNNCCDIGDRIPAFFTNSGGFLQLATQINENGNLVERSPRLEENIWYKVEVEQFFDDHTDTVRAIKP